MNEGVPQESNSEQVDPKALTTEEVISIHEDYLRRYPNPIQVTGERMEEYAEKIGKFKELVAAFESTHSLSDLHAITDLTSEEAVLHPIWEPARKDLVVINGLLNTIGGEAKVLLRQEYRRLSQAVGVIVKGKLDHTR